MLACWPAEEEEEEEDARVLVGREGVLFSGQWVMCGGLADC